MNNTKFLRMHMMDRSPKRIDHYAESLNSVMSDSDEVFGGMWSKSVNTFEENIKKLTGYQYAIATSNGTSAICIYIDWFVSKCKTSGITPIFFIPTHTYPSVISKLVSRARINELEIVVYTVDPITNIANSIDIDITTDILTQGICIIPVNINNHYVDCSKLLSKFKTYGIFPHVIHDSAQSLGATVCGRSVVSTIDEPNISTIISFSIGKMISSGEGGMLLTNDADLYHSARTAVFYGVSIDTSNTTNIKASDKQFFSMHQYNLDLNSNSDGRKSAYTGVQAAVANSQLHYIDDICSDRLGIGKAIWSIMGNSENRKLLHGNCITYPFLLPEEISHNRCIKLQSNLFKLGVGTFLGLRNIVNQTILLNNKQYNLFDYLNQTYSPKYTSLSINTNTTDSYSIIHMPCHTMMTEYDIDNMTRKLKLSLKRL